MRSRVAVVFAALLVASVVAPAFAVGAVAAQDGGDAANTTNTSEATPTETKTPIPSPTPTPEATDDDDDESSGWTLDELRRDGSHPSDSPASVRFGGDRMLWLIHWPARAFSADVGNPTDNKYKFVGEKPVTDSSVYIRSIRKETGTDDFTVKVVSYKVDEKVVTNDDGSTTRERVPADVRERSVDVSLGRGWSIAEVPLDNVEEDREVLMYVEGQEDDLRWTFRHEPVATSQVAPISTEGDYLYRVATQIFVPAVGMLFLGGFISRRAIKNAGKGPGLGLFSWVLLFALTAFLGYVLGPVESTADLLVTAPTVLAVVIALIATIVFLESYEVRTRKALFVKLNPLEVTAPTATSDGNARADGGQEKALDALFANESTETIVEMPDGTEAVVRDGLFPFLSRALGGCAARLSKSATRKSRVELEGGEHDEMIFVAPDFEGDGDSAIDYTPEGWELVWPEIEDWRDLLQPAAVVTLIGVVAASVWQFEPIFGGVVAVAGFAVWLVRPTEGEAAFRPAQGHTRAAIVTAMMMATNVSNAETLEKAREENIRERARTQKEVEEALDKQDSTIIEEAHSLDVERSVTKDANGNGDLDSADLDALEEVAEGDD